MHVSASVFIDLAFICKVKLHAISSPCIQEYKVEPECIAMAIATMTLVVWSACLHKFKGAPARN